MADVFQSYRMAIRLITDPETMAEIAGEIHDHERLTEGQKDELFVLMTSRQLAIDPKPKYFREWET